MACWNRLMDLLESQGVPYQTARSGPGEVAVWDSEHAASSSINVVVAPDRRAAMFVLPADAELDLRAAESVLGRRGLRLAASEELERLFPDCEPGAMPAFGNWYGMPVYLDSEIARADWITFPAGRRDESVTIPTPTLERLARAVRAEVGRRPVAVTA